MKPSDLKVLFISSIDPLIGPGRIGIDYYTAYKQAGFDVDFLTLKSVSGYNEFKYIFKKDKKPIVWRAIDFIKKRILHNKRVFSYSTNHHFFYRYEEMPPIANSLLLSKIDKQYDICVVLFWQELLSFSSIKAIYDKCHCMFHFLGVDYSQMSGGCHFVGDCEGYKTGCEQCNAVKPIWLNNFASHNVKYRKKVYDEIKPIVGGNTYMIEHFYKQSFLLKNARLTLTDAIMDLDMFHPHEQIEIRQKLGLQTDKSFYILFGCQSTYDSRKGMKYLFEALSTFKSKLNESENTNIIVLTVGRVASELSELIPFDSYHFGYVTQEKLIEIYSAADVFLSSTINDAGPVMINQSQACGTPVVSFEMGGALDCIKDQNTGYCAKLRDSEDFAKGIENIYRLSDSDKTKLRQKNRDFAMAHYSYAAAAERLKVVYNAYNESENIIV